MHPFDVLGDPVRRRILELLAAGERAAGEIVADIAARFDISQPAVSRHLRLLREAGFAQVRAAGNRRLYRADPHGIEQAAAELDRLRPAEPQREALPGMLRQRLDALHTEVARGRRERDRAAEPGRRERRDAS